MNILLICDHRRNREMMETKEKLKSTGHAVTITLIANATAQLALEWELIVIMSDSARSYLKLITDIKERKPDVPIVCQWPGLLKYKGVSVVYKATQIPVTVESAIASIAGAKVKQNR